MKMRLFIMDNFNAGFPLIRFMTFIFVIFVEVKYFVKNEYVMHKMCFFGTNLSKLPKMWLCKLEFAIGLILVTFLGKGSSDESATSIGESDLDNSVDVCLRNQNKNCFI